MGLEDLIAKADWATVIVSGVVSLSSVILTNWIAWANYRRTHRLEDRTEVLLRKMLKDPRYRQRKFDTIQAFIPLQEEKLREALLRAGAIRLKEIDGSEMWGLIEHHKDRAFPKKQRQS